MVETEKISAEINAAIVALERAAKLLKPEPEEKKLPKFEDVRGILAEKSREGFTKEIRELLEKHGASKLSQINPQDYPVLLQEVEALSYAK